MYDAMGTFSVPIEVIAADGSRSVTVDAMVDAGSTYTCLPDTLLRDLGITPRDSIRTELADGSIVEDGVGEVRVRVEGIESTTVVVFADVDTPSRVGAYTLTGALLAVDPVEQKLYPTRSLRMGSSRYMYQ